jgi:hypothetical protein
LKGRELAGQGDEAEVLRRVEKVAQKTAVFHDFSLRSAAISCALPLLSIRFSSVFRGRMQPKNAEADFSSLPLIVCRMRSILCNSADGFCGVF